MATLLDALSQENLDNQRDVVKNEKRQSYDNRPYGSFYEKLMARGLPGRPPLPPHADRLDGGPRRREPRGRDRVLPDLLRPEQRGPDRRRRRRGGGRSSTRSSGSSGRSSRTRTLRDVPPASARARRSGRARSCPTTCPLERVHVGYRSPAFGTREFDALEVATHILAGGRGSRLYRRLVRDEQVAQDVAFFALPLVAGSSIAAGWVTARPESDAATVEAILDEELERMTREPVTDDELARAHALVESAEYGALSRMDEVADRLSMYATYFDRPELVNEQLGRYLAVDAEAIRSVCARIFDRDARAVITYVPRAAVEAAA